MKNKLLVLTENATSMSIKNETVDLIIAFPPYFLVDSDRYGGNPKNQINFYKEKKKMLKLLINSTKEMIRVLKPGGHIIIANGPAQHIDKSYLLETMKIKNMNYVDTIYQNYFNFLTKDLTQEDRIYNTIIQWHHFTKGKMGYYNPYELKKYKNSVWEFPSNNYHSEIDKELEKMGYFVLDTINENLVEAFISIFSKSGQTVLAQFGGSGVAAIQALKMKRNAITNDISEEQSRAVYDRIKLCGLEKYID